MYLLNYESIRQLAGNEGLGAVCETDIKGVSRVDSGLAFVIVRTSEYSGRLDISS